VDILSHIYIITITLLNEVTHLYEAVNIFFTPQRKTLVIMEGYMPSI
jgi:hypothetical protein